MWFRRPDSDFEAEIESHIRLEADRLIAEGLPAAEAQDAARRAFGNAGIALERFYESQRWMWWDQLRQDLRYGLRWLRKSPAFTVAAALTIALGVGANTAMFSLVDAVLLQSLPVREPKQLVFLEAAGSGGRNGPPPYPCFERLRTETGSFAGLTTFASDELRVVIGGKPEQVLGQIASGNYFQLLGLKPALGRLMDPEDEQLNPAVAVISDRYWRRRFGGDPGVIGKTIIHNSRTFTIVGVTPPEFWGLEPGRPVDVTLPITIARNLLANSDTWWMHGIVGRLKPGVSLEEAQADSNVVFQSFMTGTRFPAELIRKHFHHMELGPAAHGMDGLRRRFSKPLAALMGIAGMVLLLAAANIANLLLARGTARRREFAIRLAAGAGRLRLTRQLLTETLLLFAIGAVPGVALSRWGVSAIESMFAEGRRAITVDATLNWRVLAFSIAVTLAAGLVAGLLPAWRALRAEEFRSSTRLAGSLVGFQVALSLVLVVGAVTFVSTLVNLRSVDPGFRNDQVLTMSVQAAGESAGPWIRMLDAVRGIPGVRTAALAIYTPLSGRDRGMRVQVRGFQPATFEDGTVHWNHVSEGYFETLGISLLRGRLLTERDSDGAPNVAVINESAARHFFGQRDPIGESLEFTRKESKDAYRIIGIVRDTKHRSLREPSARFAYLPIRQPRDREKRVTLAIASALPEGLTIRAIRGAITQVDPELMISDVITMRRQLDTTLLTERLLSGLSAVFGTLALALASIGLYGVLSYRVGQQKQAIGIRMALGAPPGSVAFGVLRQSAFVVVAGLACGLPFAFLGARAAESMLWGVKPGDPATYAAAVAVLCLAALASAWLPARRASAVDPAEALRQG